MTSRQRVRAALEHKQPDRVPVDFGGAPTTGISASLVYRLRAALGLKEIPVKVVDCCQMLGEVDDELLDALGADCVPIPPRCGMFGFPNDGWKPWTMSDGTPVLVPGLFNTERAADGGFYQYPCGDRTARPSGYMPKDGHYFDVLVRQEEIDDDNLNVADNLEEFTPISDEDLRHAEKYAAALASGGRAVIATPGTTALGDIALVPGPTLRDPKGIRDYEEWYVSMLTRQSYLKELFDRQSELAVENLKLYKEAVGDKVDIIYLCGADFGGQTGPLCSVELFDSVYLPYYRRMTGWIHEHTNWKVFKHCCGGIVPLMESFIRAGFDILNPVQNSAAGMDPQLLKDRFGDRVTFWGGGVDTQKTLPFGTPQEVREEVSERICIYNRGGGFVFNTIHNALSIVSAENFLAMVEAVRSTYS